MSAKVPRFFALTLALSLFGLTACQQPPQLETQAPAPVMPTTTMATLEVYLPDANCETLVPTQVEAAQTDMEGAIAIVIDHFNTADYAIAGYRVALNPQTHTATIDLRTPPNSRPLQTLSACQQFALFGSLRQTLTHHATWQIQTVEFTQQGEAIVL
ncbi:hypothetical protein VB712_11930 [Spirulina sp. CCNP1310]|uniref:hypothetical protein n=1 Tax=Spirulina sp. CCNP1310 TaxID=3110249 RepID=UPI002B215006|nr:hypothetical protein [Spirulina sp. CCNP1310]MEA5419931.1 hypothetical protein [Spirulina sp. CCNP1310]